MKNLTYYRQLPYTRAVELHDAESGRYWVVAIEELPGCVIHGASLAEAHANLNEVFDEYVETMLAEGLEIREPDRPLNLGAQPIVRSVRQSRAPSFKRLPPRQKKGARTITVDRQADEGVTELEALPL